MYSNQHLVALALTALLLLTIFLIRRHLRKPSWNQTIRYGGAILLFVLHAGLHLWYITTNNWTWVDSLPLHLCTLSLLLSAILLVTRNYRLYEFVYFAGIGGALQALFTPVLDVAFPHFWYFYFFIGHAGIVATAVFMTAVEQFRPTWKSIIRTMLWLNVLLLVILPVNAWTGSNYMFLSGKPNTPSLLDVLGPWPWYIAALEGIALICFIVLYLPIITLSHLRKS